MKAIRTVMALYWQQFPGWFAIGLILAILSAIAGVGFLAAAGFYTGAAATGLTATTALLFGVLPAGIAIRIFAIYRTIGRYLERVISHNAMFHFLTSLRLAVYDGIAHLKFERLRRYRSGELLARLTSDIDALDGLYLRVLMPMIAVMAALLLFLIVFLTISPAYALVMFAILGTAAFVLPWRAGVTGLKLGRHLAITSESLRLRLIDLLRGQRELVLTGRLQDQQALVDRAGSKLSFLQDKLNRYDLRGRVLMTLLGQLAIVAAMLMAAYAFKQDDISAPAALFLVLATFGLTELLAPIRRGFLEIGKSRRAASRMVPLLQNNVQTAAPLIRQGALGVRMDGVCFAYSNRAEPVLRDLSLCIRPGENIGIVGPSGSGKSTILLLACGLLEPSNGSVAVCDGDQIDHQPVHAAGRIGVLTQRAELFRDSLEANVHLGRPDTCRQDVLDALDKSQLSALVNRLPDGIDSQLGNDGAGLSGGEGRRLALARTFLLDPDLWLLDEVTEGLDEDTARTLIAAIDQASKSKTMIFATHKRSEAALANRILVLKPGSVPEWVERNNAQAWTTMLDGLRQN
ncbi:MAG: thiol reductant ABC exporter subunit CydC [Hyphomicrobiales bacterium]|nr:MAG: thiol reductant ABC exporter subunit CydC [Hyphomicrobiales bacterium]